MAYGFLVALPVLGLAGILKFERNLAAPISVSGLWEVQVDAGKLAALPCGGSLAAEMEPGFTIVQSGRKLALSLANKPANSFSGKIEGTSISATLSTSAGGTHEPHCRVQQAFLLAAAVNAQASPTSLQGTLKVDDCPSCSPVEFQAVRKVETGPQGVH